jgi:tetratricopeptide (TPR) repeat protein
MISFFLFSMGRRHQLGRLSLALLVLAGVQVGSQQPLQAGEATSEPPLVAQATQGAVAVPPEVKAWRQQVQLLYQQEKFAEAIPLQAQDLTWTETTHGSDHPDTATSLNNLAKLYKSQGRYGEAEPLLRRGIGNQSIFLQGQLPLLPQAARLAQVQALGSGWEGAFSGADRSGSAAELAACCPKAPQMQERPAGPWCWPIRISARRRPAVSGGVVSLAPPKKGKPSASSCGPISMSRPGPPLPF